MRLVHTTTCAHAAVTGAVGAAIGTAASAIVDANVRAAQGLAVQSQYPALLPAWRARRNGLSPG
jgi:hypothetical protein